MVGWFWNVLHFVCASYPCEHIIMSEYNSWARGVAVGGGREGGRGDAGKGRKLFSSCSGLSANFWAKAWKRGQQF